MTITIRPIRPGEVVEAKRLILSVARSIFEWDAPLEDVIRDFDARGTLKDLDDPIAHYIDHGGTFLVAIDEDRLIGTGAIRPLEGDAAELKRLWLAEPYLGRGIGHRLLMELLARARSDGYKRVRLLTDVRQSRAMRFYERAGFHRVDCSGNDPNDICMELALSADHPIEM